MIKQSFAFDDILEKKFKILRTSIMLGNLRNKDETLSEYEETAREIDKIRSSVYEEHLEAKMYTTVTLEEEKDRLEELISFIENRDIFYKGTQNFSFAKYYKPDEEAYNTQLNMYERGLTMEKCDEFFATLREHIVPLIKKIVATGKNEKLPKLTGFSVEKQKNVKIGKIRFILTESSDRTEEILKDIK